MPPETIGDALADAYNALHDEELAMFPDAHSRPARHTLTSRDFAAPMQIQCDLMAVLGEG